MAGSSNQGGKTEVRRLRERADLTQEEAASETGIPLRTFQGYDRGETEPPTDRMDHIRNVLGEAAGESERPASFYSEHVRPVRVQHAGGGPGQAPDAEEEILLDERLFAGSGIDFDDHVFIRIKGNSMGEVLSHGQIVFAEPTCEVVGQDIYVYWRGDEEGNVVAIIDRVPGGLRIEKRGPTRSVTEWKHVGGDLYENERGRQTAIQIKARVLGAFSRPAKELAERQASAISAATALQM